MTFFTDHWLAFLCLGIALAFGAAALIHRLRRGVWHWTCYLPAVIFASYGLGAFGFLPWWLGPALILTAFAGFVAALAVVIVKGFWSAPAGYALASILLFGLGDLSTDAATNALQVVHQFLTSLRAQEPWWLLLLLMIPALFWTSWRNLVTLGPARRWIVLGLRGSLIGFLALALAETFAP